MRGDRPLGGRRQGAAADDPRRQGVLAQRETGLARQRRRPLALAAARRPLAAVEGALAAPWRLSRYGPRPRILVTLKVHPG